MAINPEHSAHCVTEQSHYNRAVIMHLSQEDSLCSPPHSFSHRTMSQGHTPVCRGRPLLSALLSSCKAAHPTPLALSCDTACPALPCPAHASPPAISHYFLPRAPGHLAGDRSLPGPEDTKYQALTSQACRPEPRTLTQSE